mmetsp:Transcript_19801/g.62985  ORF Transcript_19801/g.62985 Transcript_19801/m.62985 type:complete len:149 (+) Transcript_19801:184-630(+)|eukprot:CAMPEP_0182863968 /NCGR_PEP_ID=MMETSP0034_2-20130328/6928_1 /TAXON_ID=156128 /ORGANISM="Nephroselmis pyriformis, Strain CCMP717" /LENGTH=148 /DNA_ID=CAMNT_0024996213 /DNA_START=381 /DNA_END=827 /DNA_ORIENTATION=-
MSAVERVGWLDNAKSNAIKESIVKEEKLAMESFLAQERQREEDDPEYAPLVYEAPSLYAPKPPTPVMEPQDPQHKLMDDLSRNLWRGSNPGYTLGASRVQSLTKDDFVYDPDELEPCDKTHFRKRDNFTNYIEASARYKLLMKKNPEG